ncbi:MAG TPA: hypothetical protein VMH35_04710, partial [Streptosporangiaceae bacterium]|nr:hypothetical protein [Streptosporangiaceae bacterium]
MRVMLMIKGDPEPGAVPSTELLAAMGRYNDELRETGLLVDLAELLPSAEGSRVKFSGGSRAVINGPFDESKKLIAGYWADSTGRRNTFTWRWANGAATRMGSCPGGAPGDAFAGAAAGGQAGAP